jgi:hypothetical protein
MGVHVMEVGEGTAIVTAAEPPSSEFSVKNGGRNTPTAAQSTWKSTTAANGEPKNEQTPFMTFKRELRNGLTHSARRVVL